MLTRSSRKYESIPWSIHSSHPSDSDFSKSHEMLRDLQKLKITECSFNIKISEGLQCKLTSLFIKMVFFPPNESQKLNLRKLLESQCTTPKRLIVEGWAGVEATKIFFHMPNLAYLKLSQFNCYGEIIDWDTINLHRNTAITNFILDRSIH